MNLLDGVLHLDMALAFTNTDEFGESIVYTTRAGVATTYKAQVFRDPPKKFNDSPQIKMEVHLPRDTTGTLGPASINSGGDTITVAYRIGQTATVHLVSAPVMQDAAGWVLNLS